MATLRVDTLDFHFRPEIDARKYDESQHYREVVQKQGKRAVDVVAVEVGSMPRQAWFIEAKDYRVIRGEPKDFKPSAIADDVYRKVNDTQEGLEVAAANAPDGEERAHAIRALAAASRRIVLHLEPYAGPRSKLFPDPTAAVLQKLKQLFALTGPPVLVLNIKNTRKAEVPWTVS